MMRLWLAVLVPALAILASRSPAAPQAQDPSRPPILDFYPLALGARFEYRHHGTLHNKPWQLTAHDPGAAPAGDE